MQTALQLSTLTLIVVLQHAGGLVAQSGDASEGLRARVDGLIRRAAAKKEAAPDEALEVYRQAFELVEEGDPTCTRPECWGLRYSIADGCGALDPALAERAWSGMLRYFDAFPTERDVWVDYWLIGVRQLAQLIETAPKRAPSSRGSNPPDRALELRRSAYDWWTMHLDDPGLAAPVAPLNPDGEVAPSLRAVEELAGLAPEALARAADRLVDLADALSDPVATPLASECMALQSTRRRLAEICEKAAGAISASEGAARAAALRQHATALRAAIPGAWKAARVQDQAFLGQSRIQLDMDPDRGYGRIREAVEAAEEHGSEGLFVWAAGIYTRAANDVGREYETDVLERQRARLDYFRRNPLQDPMEQVWLLVDTTQIFEAHWLRAEAAKFALEALDLAKRNFGADSIATIPGRIASSNSIKRSGDYETALEMQRANLAICEANPDVPPWMHATCCKSLGHTCYSLGLWDEAIRVMETGLSLLPDDDTDPAVNQTRAAMLDNLAASYRGKGDTDKALELVEQALAINADVRGGARFGAMGGKAQILHRMGRFAEAADWWDRSIPGMMLLPDEELQAFEFLRDQALTLAALEGGAERLARSLDQTLDFSELARKRCQTVPGRRAFELANEVGANCESVLSVVDRVPEERREAIERRAFAVLEDLRGIDLRAEARINRLMNDERFRQQRDTSRAARARVAQLVATGRGSSAEVIAAEAARARQALDVLLETAATGAGIATDALTVQDIAERLPARTAALCYRVVRTTRPAEDDPGLRSVTERFEAHVVRLGKGGDAQFHRVDLGPAQEVRDAVARWANEITIGHEVRGIGGKKRRRDEAAPLQKIAFDPVRKFLGDEDSLVVCLDDALHEIPFEALPAVEDYQVRYPLSLSRLGAAAPARLDRGSLLAVGGLDYDGLPEADAEEAMRDLDRAPDLLDAEAENLPASAEEVADAAKAFRKHVGDDAVVTLTRQEATPEAVSRAMERATQILLSTHGYLLDPYVERGAEARLATIHRLAPMTLAGLCLSGVNRSSEDYVGAISAEQIAGLDLSRCDLVVLSACGTYLGGTNRRGHGFTSVQAAFHAAGVPAVVSTRWKVNDEVAAYFTKRLFSYLWARKEPLRDAFRKTVDAVRKKFRGETRHWAAFVLTGADT